MRTFDIVAAAFGRDRGAQRRSGCFFDPLLNGGPFGWVQELPPAQQSQLWGEFDNMLFRLDGNLFGRRAKDSRLGLQ